MAIEAVVESLSPDADAECVGDMRLVSVADPGVLCGQPFSDEAVDILKIRVRGLVGLALHDERPKRRVEGFELEGPSFGAIQPRFEVGNLGIDAFETTGGFRSKLREFGGQFTNLPVKQADDPSQDDLPQSEKADAGGLGRVFAHDLPPMGCCGDTIVGCTGGGVTPPPVAGGRP